MLRQGYGCFKIAGKMYKAHRVSYAFAGEAIPLGLFVCHHCDNPRCVRPDHLFLGTIKDNTADMLAKGRGFVTRPENKRRKVPLERHGSHLPDEYGVPQTTISAIVRGKVWKEQITLTLDLV